MSRGQRLGLIAVAVAVAAGAFVVARPSDEEGERATPAADRGERQPTGAAGDPTATTDSRPAQRIRLRGHRPSGGVRRIEAKKGELVRMVFESDAPDQIHVHGYDIERNVRPGEPARFSFRADLEGIFEVESHGSGELLAKLEIRPK